MYHCTYSRIHSQEVGIYFVLDVCSSCNIIIYVVVRYNFWIDEWHMKELRVWVSEINFRREIFSSPEKCSWASFKK